MLNNFNMSASVSLFPRVMPSAMPGNIVVTRGATGILDFNFQSKIYKFVDLDQFAYTLAYGKTIKTFQMFIYMLPTADETVNPEKIYYTLERMNEETNQCIATVVASPAANPKTSNYYEVTDLPVSWRDENTLYAIDPHFIWNTTSDFDYISLRLNATETLEFKAGETVECEAVIRLNTEDLETLGGRDSIIIEPQPSLIIVDSISARAGG